MTSFSSWYCLKIKPMAERRASRELRRLGLRVYVPQRTTTRRKIGSKPKRRPLLTGYILVRFPLRLMAGIAQPFFGIIRADTRVADVAIGWLCWTARDGERRPVPISDRDIRDLVHRRGRGDFDDEATTKARREAQWAAFRSAMKAGTEVRIIDGAFSSFIAIIESLEDDGEGAWVLVKGFGRETRVHINEPAQQLAPLDKLNEAA